MHAGLLPAGHDHTLQVLEEDGVVMLLSGGGGKDNGTYEPTKFNLFGSTETVSPGIPTGLAGCLTCRVCMALRRVLCRASLSVHPSLVGVLCVSVGWLSV